MCVSINSTLSTSRNKKAHTSALTIIGQYKLNKTIGKGTFGKVKLGIHLQTQELVAIKIIDKTKLCDKRLLNRIEKEIKYLKCLSHQNIIQLYEVIENKSCIYFIMEYANGGDLLNYLIKNGRVTEQEASYFFSQIIHGIEAIHHYKLCHRDIKPENILLTDKKLLKIIDFGLSSEYSQSLTSACGSFCYSSPEIIQGQKYDGLNADLWSSGIILYAMVCGYLPFEDTNNEILSSKIIKAKIEFPNENDCDNIIISSECKDLIRRMLNVDPSNRLSLEEINRHPFLEYGNKKYDELLAKTNEYSKANLKQIIIDNMVNVFNYNRKEVQFSIEKNKFDSITTTYKLLRKQYIERFSPEEQVEPQRKQCDLSQDIIDKNTNYLHSEKVKKIPKESIVPCRIVKTSISSNNSIILDLDNAIRESNTIDRNSNLIMMMNNNSNMASKPLKMNPMLNRLISSINDNNNNIIIPTHSIDKKANASVSVDKFKKKNEDNTKPKPNSSKQKNDKPKPNTYRYHRNRFPLTSILFTTNNNQTSQQRSKQSQHHKRNQIEELQPQHTDRQKRDTLDPILIINSIKRATKTTKNSKRNSKEKRGLNIQKPKRKLNTLLFSNDINNTNNTKVTLKQISAINKITYIKKTSNITTHHSPFKSELTGKSSKANTPNQKQYLFSEAELNKISTELYHKKHTPKSKNRLLIIQKPKHDFFALLTSKLAPNVIEKNLKSYCDSNKLKIEGGDNQNNSYNNYMIFINNTDKFAIEISLCDNLTLLKFYHLNGNEELTKEYIKKTIINVGF